MARKPSTRHYPAGQRCPVAECSTLGSEPGLKRHCQFAHGLDWTEVYFEEAELPTEVVPEVATSVFAFRGRLIDLMILDAMEETGFLKLIAA